jgi:integrase
MRRHNRGWFKKGHDPRRHELTFDECSRGGRASFAFCSNTSPRCCWSCARNSASSGHANLRLYREGVASAPSVIYYVYFLCLARTGRREGEALGLFWGDIQFGKDANDPHRFIHVRQTYDPAHHAFSSPKNGRSRRVDMSKELHAALLDLRNQRFDAAVLQGTTIIPRTVFCGLHGRPMSSSWLYRVHQHACELAGLRVNRIHDLRHSYATIQLYEHHAPIQYVSEQLDHRSISITVDIYGHPRQGTSIALADRLDHPTSNVRRYAPSAQLDGI